MPEKVKLLIENSFVEELKYFQKKYSLKFEILSDEKFIIPEYKIELLNKSKKIINSFENFKGVKFKEEIKKIKIKDIKQSKKTKSINKKVKTKKILRTLWIRRKKKLN